MAHASERRQPAAAAASSLESLLDRALASESVEWTRVAEAAETSHSFWPAPVPSCSQEDSTDERLNSALRAVTQALRTRHAQPGLRASLPAVRAAAYASDERTDAASARCERSRLEWRRLHLQVESERASLPLQQALLATKLACLAGWPPNAPLTSAGAAEETAAVLAESDAYAAREGAEQQEAIVLSNLQHDVVVGGAAQTPAAVRRHDTPQMQSRRSRVVTQTPAIPMPSALHRRALRAAAAWDSE